MPTTEIWTPPKAASKIVKVVEAVSAQHGINCFPLNVTEIALETSKIFGWSDPISRVEAANIKGFEGALIPNESRSQWLILYNDTYASPGRVRFTLAHELGHYVLHRASQDGFRCDDSDVLGWPGNHENIETQADAFASYLLMPINEFRKITNVVVDLNILSLCADYFGVSLSAAVLKWLQFTDEKAVLVMSKSGFIDWTWSSESAFRSGAFFRSKEKVIEIPRGTLAVDGTIKMEREGKEVPMYLWFEHANRSAVLREMKISMGQFDATMTLLILPKTAECWPQFNNYKC